MNKETKRAIAGRPADQTFSFFDRFHLVAGSDSDTANLYSGDPASLS